jgi:hypothetical protein
VCGKAACSHSLNWPTQLSLLSCSLKPVLADPPKATTVMLEPGVASLVASRRQLRPVISSLAPCAVATQVQTVASAALRCSCFWLLQAGFVAVLAVPRALLLVM